MTIRLGMPFFFVCFFFLLQTVLVLRFKFRTPKPIELTKKWFESPFPDCHKIIKEEIDKLKQDGRSEVDITAARVIYRRIKNKTSSQDADLNQRLQDQMKEIRDCLKK